MKDEITEVMGVQLNLLQKNELSLRIKEYLHDDRLDVLLFVDTGMVMEAAERKPYAMVLEEALLVLPGETALFTRKETALLKEQKIMFGQECLDLIFKSGDKEITSVYLVGDNEKKMLQFLECCKKQYNNISVAGAYYVEPELKEELKVSDEIIVNEINGNDTDILVVMMDSPRQEEWIQANKTILRAKICIGIGCVTEAYVHFQGVAGGLLSYTPFQKLHRSLITRLRIKNNHKRRIFQKRAAHYKEDSIE